MGDRVRDKITTNTSSSGGVTTITTTFYNASSGNIETTTQNFTNGIAGSITSTLSGGYCGRVADPDDDQTCQSEIRNVNLSSLYYNAVLPEGVNDTLVNISATIICPKTCRAVLPVWYVEPSALRSP